MKRGQATLFVILGMVLISLTVVGYTLKEQISSKAADLGLIRTSSLSPQFEEKKSEIEKCMQELLESSTLTVISQGGYAGKPSQESFMLGELAVPYYFDRGESNVPTKETIAEEIKKLMIKDIAKCAEAYGEPGKPRIEIIIDDKKITSKTKMPMRVIAGDRAETLDDFEASTKIALGQLLNSISEMVAQQTKDSLCLTCINEVAVANNLEASLQSRGETTIFTIKDKNSLVNDEPAELTFAMRH